MFDPNAASSTRYGVELVAALDAVKKAARLCEAVQQRLVAGATLEKGDKSPVTVADFGAQAVVSHLLWREFPHVPLIGEEDAAALRDPAQAALRDQVLAAVHDVLPDVTDTEILDAIDRGTHAGGPTGAHFTLDPIDGTKGFLRQEQYAVALALVVDGVVKVGVLGCPNLAVDDADPARGRGVLAWGVKGEGARVSPLARTAVRPLFVDEITDPAEARFCESVESGHSDQSTSAAIARRLGITREPYRIDSQCKYVAVARGDASIYLRLPVRADYVEKVWDHAAGAVVIQEAGGRVSDVDGKPLDFSAGRRLEGNRGVVVTNAALHDRVLEAVSAELS